MKDGFAHFDRRLEMLEDKKAALDQGHRLEVDPNGLMTLSPTGVRRRKLVRLLPLRALMIIAFTLLTFKGFLLFQLGLGTYTAKVTAMAKGDTMDQIGAYLMQIEPVTLWLYEVIRFIAGQ